MKIVTPEGADCGRLLLDEEGVCTTGFLSTWSSDYEESLAKAFGLIAGSKSSLIFISWIFHLHSLVS